MMAAFKLYIVVFVLHASFAIKLDLIDCGVDEEDEISIGDIPIAKYPWFGILWYSDETMGGDRAVTQVALIHAEFLLASAHMIEQIPKDQFRRRSFVLLGEDWVTGRRGRRVRNYVIHPEYGETHATLALVQLRDPLRLEKFRPLCPPPEILPNPTFYVIRFKDDYNYLQKEVIPMYYVPPRLCRDFYVHTNLDDDMLRPPHVVCACSMEHDQYCVWDWSAALVMKDVWGRWVLLGLSVYGPGCSGPSRYLDMLSYYPWVQHSLDQFRVLTISKIHPHKFVLRASAITNYDDLGHGVRKMTQRYGDCDNEERRGRMYREIIFLKTDNNQFQFFAYNMTITQAMEVTCLSMELINATADATMNVRHICPREVFGPRCYDYDYSIFDIAVSMMFSDNCMFEMNVFGYEKYMKLLDTLTWHWEEGTYYEDFAAARVEFRGPTIDTTFGFEPLDPTLWLPDYDVYSTTDASQTTSTTTRSVTSKSEDLYWAEKKRQPIWTVKPLYRYTIKSYPKRVKNRRSSNKRSIYKRSIKKFRQS